MIKSLMLGDIAMGRVPSQVAERLGQLFFLLLGLVVLQACGSTRTTLYPAPPPDSAAVFRDYQAFKTTWTKLGGNELDEGDTDALRAFVSTGYLLAQRECLTFFINLRLIRNDTDFAKDAARNVMASAGLISALASVPTAVLSGLFAATGVVPSVIGDFQNTFLFAAAGDSLYPQIYTAMSDYRSKFPSEICRKSID